METHILKQVEISNYLGSSITQKGKCDEEIKRRIGMTKNSLSKREHILKNMSLRLELRKRLLECYVLPILKYDCEAWTLNSDTTR